MANSVALQRTQLKWNEVRWDKTIDTNVPLEESIGLDSNRNPHARNHSDCMAIGSSQNISEP